VMQEGSTSNYTLNFGGVGSVNQKAMLTAAFSDANAGFNSKFSDNEGDITYTLNMQATRLLGADFRTGGAPAAAFLVGGSQLNVLKKTDGTYGNGYAILLSRHSTDNTKNSV